MKLVEKVVRRTEVRACNSAFIPGKHNAAAGGQSKAMDTAMQGMVVCERSGTEDEHEHQAGRACPLHSTSCMHEKRGRGRRSWSASLSRVLFTIRSSGLWVCRNK